jgi:hypothetical protein
MTPCRRSSSPADRQRTDFEIAHQPCRNQPTLALTNTDVAGMHHVHGRGHRGSPKDHDPETGGRGECSIIVYRQTQTTDLRHERALREPCRRGGKGGQARIIGCATIADERACWRAPVSRTQLFDPSSTWLAEARSAPPVTWRTSPSERPLGPSPPKPAQDTADTPPRCRRQQRLPRAELPGERRVLLDQRVFEFGEFSPLPLGQLHPASSRRPLPDSGQPASPPVTSVCCGDASITVWSAGAETWMRRGLALSATGMLTVSTPLW